jgi:RNA polymerase sigma-70 factor, ECF subfamily
MGTGFGDEKIGDHTFAELLVLAHEGSLDALGKVLESCRHVLHRAAARQIPGYLLARFSPSDAVQETFLEAQKDFERFLGTSREELMAWLSQLLRNNCLNLVRFYRQRAKRRPSLEIHLDDDSASWKLKERLKTRAPGPSEELIEEEEWARLSPVLEALPKGKLMVLQLRFIEKLSFKEIGLRLGCSAEAARKILTRAVRQIRSEL